MFVNIPVSFSTQASLAWDPQDQPFATVSAHRCNNTILQARFCVCNIAMQVWLCGRMFFGDIQMKTPIALGVHLNLSIPIFWRVFGIILVIGTGKLEPDCEN